MDRMVGKKLHPEQQGHIDGMCSVYAVLNACKRLFNHSELMDQELFKALCAATPELFPAIVYDGVEVEGLAQLIDAAKNWVAHRHNRELICERPTHRRQFAGVDEYFDFVRMAFAEGETGSRLAVIGLDRPWNHWTVLWRVTAKRAFFFDSWGFPKRTGFDYFTFDKSLAGEGDEQKTLLAYHQTFILHVES
jgi:hypothetical protein